jgi:hypothetical protein
MWGWACYDVELTPGVHQLAYSFSTLPLKPGPYAWLVSLYTEQTELVDIWDCVPDMVVTTENYQHRYDEWNGILNLPAQFEIDSGDEVSR